MQQQRMRSEVKRKRVISGSSGTASEGVSGSATENAKIHVLTVRKKRPDA
jgi:hypothetical protein